MDSYQIQPFNEKDIQEVKNLIHHTVSKCYPAIFPDEVVQFFIDYHCDKEILRRAGSGIVIELIFENSIRATGFLDGEELGGVYVHPDFQGRGFGTAIVEYLIAEARLRSQKYIHLDSTPIAKPMYEKLGFSLVSPAVEMVGDVALNYFKMERYL